MRIRFTNSELAERLKIATEALGRAETRATAGRLALELTHEIRNPLEAVSHLTYLTKMEAEDPEKVRDYMSLADEQMMTVARISSSTLGFAQISESPKSSDLVKVVEAALRIHQQALGTNRVELKKDLPATVDARVHSGEMLQAISNLIANSIDALPSRGAIRLRLRRRSKQIDLVVTDNGCGIPQAHHARIL